MSKRIELELSDDGEIVTLDSLASDLGGLLLVDQTEAESDQVLKDKNDSFHHNSLEERANRSWLAWLALKNFNLLERLGNKILRLYGYEDTTIRDEDIKS